MNSPRLTNILLIALVAINGLLLIGWAKHAIYRIHKDNITMNYKFSGRRHDSYTFHYRFGAYRGYHRGRCCGGFRNSNNSYWN